MEAIVGNTFYFDFEVALIEFLQRVLGENVINIISEFSLLGEEIALVAILGFVYWSYDKKMGTYLGTTMILGITFTSFVKNVFCRRRPYFDNPGVKCLRPFKPEADIYDISVQEFSCPSGHSTNAVTGYSSMAYYKKKNKWLTAIGIIVPVLIGLSRVTVGVHYPTDVMLGWIVGLICMFGAAALCNKVSEDKLWISHLIIFLVSLTGFFFCRTDDYFSSIGMMAGFFLTIHFEKKFVNFKNTKKPVRAVLRVIVGAGIFIAFNTLAKMPFSKEFLSSGTFLAHLVRSVRYFLGLFLITGVYPMIFAKLDKFWKEETAE